MDLELKDRVVIVTGGGKGIGAAISASFAAEGARVAIVTRHSEESESFAKSLAAKGEVFYYPLDLSEARRCEDAVRAVKARFGGLFTGLEALSTMQSAIASPIVNFAQRTHFRCQQSH